jgi:hypothetical protein
MEKGCSSVNDMIPRIEWHSSVATTLLTIILDRRTTMLRNVAFATVRASILMAAPITLTV